MAKKSFAKAQDKGYFDPVNPKVDFPGLEQILLDKWYKNGIVKKYLSKNKNSKKYFSFLDGPITANNPMGVHHAWGRTYKDLWQRYYNMRGYKQRFQNGFDCQGLWVEVEVEKELGLKSKRDIENLVPGDKKASIAKFVQLCKDRVFKYAKIQTEQSKRLGYFVDWDHSYFTMSDENNYTIWHFLQKCHQKRLIYKGRDSVPWCPRCQTAISQHEILTEDYRELTHKAIYLELPIVGRRNEYLLVWTTTPWTIPANTAVAVDKAVDYVLVEGDSGDGFWLAKEAAGRVFGSKNVKIVKKVKGEELVGLKYRGPFDDLPVVRNVAATSPRTFHNVVATDPFILPVLVSEGTGLVHTAVSAGTEDFQLGKKLKLPMVPVINDDASYLPGMGILAGKNAASQPEIVLDYLLEREKRGENWVFAIHDFTHRYPVCWRCKTELVWKVTDEWYVAMDRPLPKSKITLRKEMMRVAKKIRWIPEFGLGRELDWLMNMHDWLISKKNRYWGLALPIWECRCGWFDVIGSKEELKKRAIAGWEEFEGRSPHKPEIDAVKIACLECGCAVSRIEAVGNPWLDAGIVPFSTIARSNQGSPLYLSNPRQWRKWFPADFISESFPGQFKNWFYALIAMSTVLVGEHPFKTVLGFATMVDQQGRGFHKSLGNAIEFREGADKAGADVIRWICVRQDPSQNLLFGYRVADETRRKFHLKLWNVYNFFVTYANIDGWKPGKKFSILNSQFSILDRWILSKFSRTAKLITESLDKFDAYTASSEIEKFVDDLSLWYIRRSRDRVGPTVTSQSDRDSFYQTTYFILLNLSYILAPLTPFLAEIIYRNLTKKESVHLEFWPSISNEFVDDTLEGNMEVVRKTCELGHSLRKKAKIPVRQVLASLSVAFPKPEIQDLEQLVKDETNVLEVEWGGKKDELDLLLTTELESMGETREIVRRIQEERKRLGTRLDEYVNVRLNAWPKEFEGEIKKKALVKSIKKGEFSVSRFNP